MLSTHSYLYLAAERDGPTRTRANRREWQQPLSVVRYLLVQLVNIHEAIANLLGKFPSSPLPPVSLLQFHSADKTFLSS